MTLKEGGGVRRRVAALALALGVLLPGRIGSAGPAGSVAPRYENTNVILISLQCLRPDHLGAYGYKRGTSSNIDAFAGRSALFENAIAQAGLTPVAQMSILTSQYARVHGMVSFEVSSEQVTPRSLPAILKYYGYTNAAVISSPEFFVRFSSATGTEIDTADVYAQAFDTVESTRRGLGPRGMRKIPDESLDWIRQNKDKKFFLWIASGLLHMPYGAAVPAPYQTMYDPPKYTPFWQRLKQLPPEMASNPDPSYEVLSRVYRNEFYWGFAPIYHLTPEDRAYVVGRYDAGVYYTDLFIGELMKLLDSLDLTKRTLIVLHSSHGDDLGERGGFFHYDITEGVVKDALMVRFPGDEFGGKRVRTQVQSIDIMPTVLNYLGVPSPHEAQGGSLLPLLRGEQQGAPSDYAYIDRIPWWEYTLSKWYLEFQSAQGITVPPAERNRLEEYRAMLHASFDDLDYPPGDIAIRTNDWKLIVRKNRKLLESVSWWGFITGKSRPVDELELYDLKTDPQEKRNVAGERPEVVARLKARLLEWDEATEKIKSRYRKDEKRLIIPYP